MEASLPTKYSKLNSRTRKIVKECYILLQKGKCWYCNESLSEEAPASIKKNPVDKTLYPRGFFSNPVHLQHNHDTDMTEGAVHAYCNAVLWEYEKR